MEGNLRVTIKGALKMWTASPKRLLAAIQVLNLIPVKTGLPSSSFVRLHEKDKRHRLWMSLSTEIAGSVSVEGVGKLGLKKPVYLDRALLFPFIFGGLKYSKKKPFVFTVEKDKLRITHGRRKGLFQYATEGSGYIEPENTFGGTELVLSEKAIGLLKVAHSCVTPDQIVPELSCVMLNRGDSSQEVRMFASNQLIVLCATRKEKTKFPRKLPLPLQMIPFLDVEGVESLRAQEKGMLLQFKSGYIWQPFSSKAEKGFPLDTVTALIEGKTYKYKDKKGKKRREFTPPNGIKISAHNTHDWPERFSVLANRFGAAIDRFADYISSVKKEDWALKIDAVGENEKYITLSSAAQQAEFREKVAVEGGIKESFTVTWPLDILLPIFQHLQNDKKSAIKVFFGEKTPYLIKAGDISIVVSRQE
jgi:hypothetical protein